MYLGVDGSGEFGGGMAGVSDVGVFDLISDLGVAVKRLATRSERRGVGLVGGGGGIVCRSCCCCC